MWDFLLRRSMAKFFQDDEGDTFYTKLSRELKIKTSLLRGFIKNDMAYASECFGVWTALVYKDGKELVLHDGKEINEGIAFIDSFGNSILLKGTPKSPPTDGSISPKDTTEGSNPSEDK